MNDESSEASLAQIVSVGLEGLKWERLYRLEIEKLEMPAAFASAPSSPTSSRFERLGRAHSPTRGSQSRSSGAEPRWKRFALIYDVHDRSPGDLLQDVVDALEGETGRFRVRIFYWEGDMVTPQTGKLMGRGQDFLYSDNPRGSTISMVEEPIEFEIQR